MRMPALAEPRHRHLCARAAQMLLRIREEGYPAAVEAGRMTQAEADRGIHLARCLVAQWRWIMDRARPACPPWDERGDLFGAYSFEMEADLVRAVQVQRARAAKRPADEAAAELTELFEALAWLQRTRHGVAWIVLRVDVERSATAGTLPRAA